MSLFTAYLEAVQKSVPSKMTVGYHSVKSGENFNIKRPDGKTARMMVEKITDSDIHYRWVDEKNNVTNGKVSKRQFKKDLDSGEAKKVELK